MVTLDLFSDTATSAPIGYTGQTAFVSINTTSPEERAVRRISAVMDAGHAIVVAFSAGKDSSCLALAVGPCQRSQIQELTALHPGKSILLNAC